MEHVNGTHLKGSSLSCNSCGFVTARKKSLQAHVSEVHNQDKRYSCTLCDFKGARKTSLDKHMQVAVY